MNIEDILLNHSSLEDVFVTLSRQATIEDGRNEERMETISIHEENVQIEVRSPNHCLENMKNFRSPLDRMSL